MRALHTISLGLIALSLPGCFDHHTADEQVLELVEIEDAGVSTGNTKADASTSKGDAGSCVVGPDIAATIQCFMNGNATGKTDAAAASGIDAIIKQILGGTGTGTQNCAKQTDPASQILCAATGGTGIEGIIGSLLGGNKADAGAPTGLDGIVNQVLTDALSGIVEDLIKGILTPQPTQPTPRADAGTGGLFGGLFGGTTGGTPTIPRRDAGAGGLFGGLFGGNGAAIGSTSQGLTDAELVRNEEECTNVDPDDILTRLVCARQNLDTLAGR